LFKEKDIEEGRQVRIKGKEDNTVPAKILKINSGKVTLDINHPLAGEDLVFYIKLLDVQES